MPTIAQAVEKIVSKGYAIPGMFLDGPIVDIVKSKKPIGSSIITPIKGMLANTIIFIGGSPNTIISQEFNHRNIGKYPYRMCFFSYMSNNIENVLQHLPDITKLCGFSSYFTVPGCCDGLYDFFNNVIKDKKDIRSKKNYKSIVDGAILNIYYDLKFYTDDDHTDEDYDDFLCEDMEPNKYHNTMISYFANDDQSVIAVPLYWYKKVVVIEGESIKTYDIENKNSISKALVTDIVNK